AAASDGQAPGVGAIVVAVAIAATAERFEQPAVLAVTATGIVALLASAAYLDARGPLFGAALVPFAMLAGLARHEYVRRAHEAELRAHSAALNERVRLSRELHDVLAHSLAALAIQLESAEALLAEHGDPERALEHVRRSRELAVDGLVETRSAVAALRGDAAPLPVALARLVDGHGGARLQVEGEPRPLGAEAELA